MEQSELEMLVGELEQRVDRLRSLYDQYFMGIEKIVPGVPHKDVERRIQILRKEQIRNTGLRFRFQMILQRFNTYQSYWIRICRQIEEGTYKRHMMRAQARFSDDAPAGKKAGVKAEAPATNAAVPPIPSMSQFELDDLDREFGLTDHPPMSLQAEFGMLDDPLTRLPSSFTMKAVQLPTDAQVRVSPRAAGAAKESPVPPPPSGSPPGDSKSRAPLWRKAPPAPPRASEQTAKPPSSPPIPAAPAPLRPAAPFAPMAPPRPAAPAAPIAPRPAPAPPPLPPRAAVAPRPAPRDPTDLPEERVRQLYVQYVDAKRQRNESTAAITYDGLAKSLRESSAKLREKHGKSVDFEVAVRDGKTVIRPVVK